MKESNYSKEIISVVEANHVNDECDSIAKHIASEIKKSIKKILSIEDLIQYTEDNDWIYSGYNVNSNYIKQFKDYIEHPNTNLIARMFIKCSEDSATNPLYYTIFYDSASRERAACNIRTVIKDAVDVKVNDNDVQIEINIAKFIDINDDINYISMMATIAHELQHIFDQYILTDRVFSSDDKNNVYYDFITNNFFKLKQNDLMLVDTILYNISHNEQRGFISEVRTLLKGISMNDTLKHNLFINNIHNNYNRYGYPLAKRKDDFDESILIEHILNIPIIKTASRVYGIHLTWNMLEQLKTKDVKHYNFIMMVIGYYMFRHNMLRLGKFNVSESEVKSYCSVYKIINGVFDDKIINVIKYSLDYENERYRRIVKSEIKNHLHNIFNYKKWIDLVDNPDDYKMNFSGMTNEQIEHFGLQEQIILYV